ncbi:tyrosine-type recombinase/integrase [Bosea sp. LjRoot237]|uniref:tyrosine-type recombinase/integrase n=1 Tax=Bosea sp. LjRoot237 TaxID=3342292 RepID=UPI003F506747
MTFDRAAAAFIAAGGSDRFLMEVGADGKPRGLVEELRGKKLASITQESLDGLAHRLYPTALRDTKVRQFYAPFRAVWNYAAIEGWAKEKKWRLPKRPKGTNVQELKRFRSGSAPTNYEHAARFVGAMSPAPAMLMTALFFTGMRPIELFVLEADMVNVPERWITLRKSKIGEGRGIPIHEFLVPLFDSLCARGGAVFRKPRGEPYPIMENAGGQIKTAIAGARRRTGIKDVSPYTARHSVSTQLVVNGVHPYVKDQILGHAVDDMSRRYTHVPQRPLIDAINTIKVPQVWRECWWWEDPLELSGRLVPGTGARNDLKERRA